MSETNKRNTMPPEEGAGTGSVLTEREHSYADSMGEKLERAREQKAGMGSSNAKRHTMPPEEGAGTGSVLTESEQSYGDSKSEKVTRAREKAEQRGR